MTEPPDPPGTITRLLAMFVLGVAVGLCIALIYVESRIR